MAQISFRTQIRRALANENLQAALDGNAERRLYARLRAISSLPAPWEELRQRAHAVKAVVVDHLDEFLAQFIERAEANGMKVLRAADGAQAVNQVLEIARKHGAKSIAKSKTMVSEEIELNHALEAAGLQVVETDLGEYIAQLRGERPSHIISPVVHLRRGEVGQTFHEKLGLAYTDDIPTLTSATRRLLRQVFLDADIGLSGVNFGVAESGILCIVTNEGNGRMVTTLPKVHIALMGLERLVPTMDDLALMLYLLPRSATGQKLSVYTSLINGPDGADGPGERYLILLDNGRMAMRRSPLAEALYCIRCGACLNACPVFREIGGHAYVGAHGEGSAYTGPIGSVVAPGLFGQETFGHLARASSLCGACKEVCPVGIDLPKLLLRVRAGEVPGGEGGSTKESREKPVEERAKPNAPGWLRLALSAFSWMARSPARFRLAQRAAGFFSRVYAPRSEWMRLPAITGWGYSKDFPRPALSTFRERWGKLGSGQVGSGQWESGQPEGDQYGSDQSFGSDQLAIGRVERFGEELAEVGGRFVRCSAAELAERILEILRERGISSVQAWEDSYLPEGLLDKLRIANIEVVQTPDPSVRAGLTGASAAIAETGSLLLCGDMERPLTASLLPEVHMAVIREEDILDNLPEGLNLREVRETQAAVIITGPSRTADIEMTLTIGVHGPGEMIVFCVPIS
jgi:L-lactate dehydrogenase complex protein LldF